MKIIEVVFPLAICVVVVIIIDIVICSSDKIRKFQSGCILYIKYGDCHCLRFIILDGGHMDSGQ